MWPKIILLCKQIIFNLKYRNSYKTVKTLFSDANIIEYLLWRVTTSWTHSTSPLNQLTRSHILIEGLKMKKARGISPNWNNTSFFRIPWLRIFIVVNDSPNSPDFPRRRRVQGAGLDLWRSSQYSKIDASSKLCSERNWNYKWYIVFSFI